MIVRSVWSNVPVPDHSTSDEIVTIPNDSSTIQELFERAARGESLGGSYDEFEDDSVFDDVHDPDLQDPLLRQANRLNTLDNVIEHSRTLVKQRKAEKKEDSKSSKFASSSTAGDEDGHSDTGADSEGKSKKSAKTD